MDNKTRLLPPVLFLVYNRPDTVMRVFEAIREAKPLRLYVAADGPKDEKPGEEEKVRTSREYVMNNIDWDCEVKTLFREKNLGCRCAVSEAITWFFKNEDRGIILEDDCIPNQSFFRFCGELLEYYKDDERVMMISGDNFQNGASRTEYSYYFSRYAHIWGWASWRRAWDKYDVNMRLFAGIRDKNLLSDILRSKKEYSYWENIFEKVYKGAIDTWDYQWLFACWIQSGLTIMPNVNLISNIGYGSDATHTKHKSEFASLENTDIVFPLEHPPFMFRDVKADKYDEKRMFSNSPLYKRIIGKIFRR